MKDGTGELPNQLNFAPREDKDIDYHRSVLEKVIYALHPVISLVEKAVSTIMDPLLPLLTPVKVKAKLPRETYERLEIIAESLPLHPTLHCRPFTGMVLNVSASTTSHRDTMDLSACAVLALGEWEGGHLCFHELGLALDLQCGDLVIFRSDLLTHYNLPHTGIRCSLVFSTDKLLSRWSRDQCGYTVPS